MKKIRFLMLFPFFMVATSCYRAPSPEPVAQSPRAPVEDCNRTQTRSYAKYVTDSWQNRGDKDSLILYVTSDPQYPRTILADGTEGSNEARSKAKLTEVFKKIKDARSRFSYAPVLINGDMTEGGHDDIWAGHQRSTLQEMLELMADRRGPLMFPGLGDHELENDCSINGCARDSTCDIFSWVKEIPQITSFDYRHFEDYPSKVHQGSFAYSFDIGSYHIVQLQREPTFERTIPSGLVSFRFKPALDWLEADLRKAKSEGKDIVLNMHIRQWWGSNAQRARFHSIITTNGVSAVFAGHLHDELGRVSADKNIYGDVPVFQSGALLNGSYLRVELNRRYATGDVQTVGGNEPSKGDAIVLRNSPPAELPPLPDEDKTRFLLFTEKNLQGLAVCDGVARAPALALGPNDPAYAYAIKALAPGNGAYWNCADDNARSAVILPSPDYAYPRRFCFFEDQAGLGAKVCARIPAHHKFPIRIVDFNDMSASGEDAQYLTKTGSSIDRDVSSTGYFRLLY
jgi:hypothetical protein